MLPRRSRAHQQRIGTVRHAVVLRPGHDTERLVKNALHRSTLVENVPKGIGVFNGKRIVPGEIVADIRKSGDKAAFAASPSGPSRPEGSYHNQWWINHDAYDSYDCAGHFGQRVWIAPKGEAVIVQLSTDLSSSRDSLAKQETGLPLTLAGCPVRAGACAAWKTSGKASKPCTYWRADLVWMLAR